MSDADEVIEAQHGWGAAIVSNDPEQIAAYQDPEWVIVTKNGVTTGDDFLGVIRAGVLSHSRMEPVGDPLARVRRDGRSDGARGEQRNPRRQDDRRR
jgi:hypothetical protein